MSILSLFLTQRGETDVCPWFFLLWGRIVSDAQRRVIDGGTLFRESGKNGVGKRGKGVDFWTIIL